MCGICGIVSFQVNPQILNSIQEMKQALHHRGPDDDGTFISHEGASVAFGFKRLSIIDLKHGHQPMHYKNYSLVFNGEVYNYKELREKFFAGEKFETQSDSEVVLRLLAKLGTDALKEFNGMFAIALWNQESKELLLARDRLGIKPLYYFFKNGVCAFSSEVKSLYQSKLFSLKVQAQEVFHYFSYRFNAAPQTLFADVCKLAPGEFLRINSTGLEKHNYWKVQENQSFLYSNPVEELDFLLKQSIDLQLISDVSVGCFLSGGIDSSLVCALAAQKMDNLHTFSVAFEDKSGVNESAYAKAVSRQYGTHHHHLLLRAQDLNDMESVLKNMTEPAADPTVLPTALLSQVARKTVKVVLTGEGADELFAGYNRYKALLYQEWGMRLPSYLRTLSWPILKQFSHGAAAKNIGNLTNSNWFALHRDFPADQVNSLLKYPVEEHRLQSENSLLNDILKLEVSSVMAERLLMKVDMSTMGSSLEARPPFLDHRLVEWALSLPSKHKVHRFKGKYILRQVANRYLPNDICWRKKHGFIVPLEFWWKQPNSKIKDLLMDYSALNDHDIWNEKQVQVLRQQAMQNPNGTTIGKLWPLAILNLHLRSLTQ